MTTEPIRPSVPGGWKALVLSNTAVGCVALVLGPVLFFGQKELTENNRAVICSLLRVVSEPQERDSGQSKAEFRREVAALEAFAGDLEGLVECEESASGGGGGGGRGSDAGGRPGGRRLAVVPLLDSDPDRA